MIYLLSHAILTLDLTYKFFVDNANFFIALFMKFSPSVMTFADLFIIMQPLIDIEIAKLTIKFYLEICKKVRNRNQFYCAPALH